MDFTEFYDKQVMRLCRKCRKDQPEKDKCIYKPAVTFNDKEPCRYILKEKVKVKREKIGKWSGFSKTFEGFQNTRNRNVETQKTDK